MQLFKFLFAIILVQIATISLVWVNGLSTEPQALLKLLIPLVFIAIIIAFWLLSMTKSYSQDKFSTQVDKLHKEAKKERESIEKQAQRDILKQATLTHAKANFKVGFAFAGLLGVGGLFILAQMMTAGLLAISATGGAMGGYYLRSKKASEKEAKILSNNDNKLLK